MDATATVWMIALLGFAGGIGFGALIYHFTRSDSGSKSKALQGRIDEVERSHQQYQDDVAKHFVHTAELVNRLTESYRDVHAHLADGAQSLCANNEALQQQLESSLANRLMTQDGAPEDAEAEKPEATSSEAAADSVEPPKDYAPKTNPAETGTLSEEFGIERKPTD